MDIFQLFVLYGSQDKLRYGIADLLSKQEEISLNYNSILFYAFHFLDEYDLPILYQRT